MATSGSTDFNPTAREVIRGAFRLIGVKHANEAPTASEEENALSALQMMIKAWQAQGIHLWTQTEATLFPTVGTAEYSIPGSRITTSFVQTALSAAASSGATSITVDSISGISDNDVLGIQTSSTAIHWTTVNGAPSGSTINFDDALTADAADDAVVYAYTSTIGRPLRIPSIRRRNSSQDTRMFEMARDEYFALPNKTSQSAPTQFYYDPQLTTGKLYLWPAPDTVDDTFKVTFYRSIEDTDEGVNNLDFPQEWMEALKFNLAVRLYPEYARKPRQDVILLAASSLEEVLGWDTEPAAVQFQYDTRGW